MKKLIALGIFLVFASVNAFAAKEGPDAARQAHREEMKKIKAAQRETRKNMPQAAADANKTPGFWEREGQRSGLGNSGSRVGNFLRNLNPVPFFKDQQERYNARKTSAVGK